ncbi:MAG: hypothetical protein ABSG67_00965 [Thermoguttaceae bacterium]|jgi:ribonuclease HII
MGYLIGTDEAGYGPNLGPLVISASVWQAPDGLRGEDLFGRLGHVIAASLKQAQELPQPCMVVADSKILYNSGGDLRHLERGLWAAWALLGLQPRTWRDAWHALAARAADEFSISPWFNAYDAPVPIDVMAGDWPAHGPPLRDALLTEGVQLIALSSRAVFPREFNELLELYGSKGALLSHLTLELIMRMISPLDGQPISVICDKHGGRNRYGSLLSEHFPDYLIKVHGESRQQSVYRIGPSGRRIEFCFRAKAESCLPAALASMASKYLRELAMQPFNEFWCSRVPGLAPTAGYPQDARRFKTAIAAAQRELGIKDKVIWRVK